MLLFDCPVSGNCYKVRLLLAHLGLPYERHHVDVVDRSNLAEGSPYVAEDAYERAQVLQWLFFEQHSHEPHVAVVRFWVAFAPEPPGEEEIAARRRAGHGALKAMDRHLTGRDFLVGDAYTVADIGLYAYTHIAGEGGFDLAQYPATSPGSSGSRPNPGTSRSRPSARGRPSRWRACRARGSRSAAPARG